MNEQEARAKAASLGIDWGKIDWLKIAQIIETILLALAQQPKAAAQVAAGCCDHKACAEKVVRLQLEALQAGIEHARACCDETV